MAERFYHSYSGVIYQLCYLHKDLNKHLGVLLWVLICIWILCTSCVKMLICSGRLNQSKLQLKLTFWGGIINRLCDSRNTSPQLIHWPVIHFANWKQKLWKQLNLTIIWLHISRFINFLCSYNKFTKTVTEENYLRIHKSVDITSWYVWMFESMYETNWPFSNNMLVKYPIFQRYKLNLHFSYKKAKINVYIYYCRLCTLNLC